MVDGEFTGPSFTRHAVVSWALVVFMKHHVMQPGQETPLFSRDGDLLPPAYVYSRVAAELCVRMHPPKGTAVAPETWRSFWGDPKQAKLLAWVQGDGEPPGAVVSQRAGMQRVNNFLERMSAVFDLRFMAKPSSTDLGRLQHCLAAWGPRNHFILHHNTRCQLTQRVLMQQTVVPYCNLRQMLDANLKRLRLPATPTHFPLEDCRRQIANHVFMCNLAIHERLRKHQLMQHYQQFFPMFTQQQHRPQRQHQHRAPQAAPPGALGQAAFFTPQ
jgi:hypothetical protein